jgi:hypothetical protein
MNDADDDDDDDDGTQTIMLSIYVFFLLEKKYNTEVYFFEVHYCNIKIKERRKT